MSSASLVSAAIILFVVAALLYYQSQSKEAFVGSQPSVQSKWKPSDKPIAGRLYNPAADDKYKIPADLSKAPVSAPAGSIPTSSQRSSGTPGTGTVSGSKESMAQLKDLRELDSKITTWLDAATTKDREEPGSLTSQQKQDMVRYQGRLAQIREQLGTGMITDTYKQVAAETLKLRKDNAKWQSVSPSLTEIHSFGVGMDPDAFLSNTDYTKFFALFTSGILELQGMVQADPLQKVRLQQLQVMRQELTDVQQKGQIPPIKMHAAKQYLVQMLKPDQPLPTLISIEAPPQQPQHLLGNNFNDILSEIKNMEFTLTVSYDPATAQLKRSLAALLDKMGKGEISPNTARSHLAMLRENRGLVSSPQNPIEKPNWHPAMPGQNGKGQRLGPPLGRKGAGEQWQKYTPGGGGPWSPHPSKPSQPSQPSRPSIPPQPSQPSMPSIPSQPSQPSRPSIPPQPSPSGSSKQYNPQNHIKRANTLCDQIREAFPEDADALGCQRVRNEFEAETVINTVCGRLRYSVPTVTPEQFGCPARNV